MKRSIKMYICTALMALAAATLASVADAQTVTTISKCGTVINSPGNYDVEQSLSSTSSTVDCIDIAAPGVGLLIGANLSGPGGASVTAAGIKILKTAFGVGLGFGGATIEGFGVGIKVEASGVTISPGGTLMGNAAQGLLVKNTESVTIGSITSQQNGGAGLELLNSSGVIVQGTPTLQNNNGYGLWINSSSGNFFVNLSTSGNKFSGVYVGSSSTDRLSPTARDAHPSRDNAFLNPQAVQNSGAGFAIELGDSHNVITGATGESNTDMDAVDENPNCDHNQWSGNFFLTKNLSCIH